MAILGDTLTLIAGEKAGIIKKNVPVVSIAVQPQEALTVLEKHAAAVSAPLFLAPSLSLYGKADDGVRLGMQGDFQQHNAALALALARIWAARCLPLPPSSALPVSAPPRDVLESWAAQSRRAWGEGVCKSWAPETAEPITAAALQRRPLLVSAPAAGAGPQGILSISTDPPLLLFPIRANFPFPLPFPAPSRSTERSSTLKFPIYTHPHTRTCARAGPGLTEWERLALASARWPARAQVVEGTGLDEGDGAGVLGGVRGETCSRRP